MNNEPEEAAEMPPVADTPEAEMPISEELNTQIEQQPVADVAQEQIPVPMIEAEGIPAVEAVPAVSTVVEDVVSEANTQAEDVAEVLPAAEAESLVAEPIVAEAPVAEMPSPEPVALETSSVTEPVAKVLADEPTATIDESVEAVAPAIEKTETAEELDDNFIKEKVAAAKAAKKKAPAKPRKPTKRERQKLPDLGDGSGYEPPEAAAAVDPDSGLIPVDENEEAFWYAVHCYSGYENKVKHSLEQRIETMGMAGRILEIVVPTEEEIEVRDGKRKTVERRVFPGYVLVRMKMSEESWFVVRNTPGVTRFIGMGNRPQPLTQQEVNQVLRRMEAEAPKIRVSFKSGQRVRITDGPFADFPGVVDKIDTERAKVTVLVSFFGRETPVELDFLQVEKM